MKAIAILFFSIFIIFSSQLSHASTIFLLRGTVPEAVGLTVDQQNGSFQMLSNRKSLDITYFVKGKQLKERDFSRLLIAASKGQRKSSDFFVIVTSP